MRVVSIGRGVGAPAVAIDEPRLDEVRDLGERFPRALLRPVTLVRARELDLRADERGATRVWLAVESLQVTGSFKVRGALVAIDSAVRRKVPRVLAVSAGNHGAGLAYAAHALGVPATVVVPRAAPLAKRARIEAFGAKLVVADSDHYDDAETIAIDMAKKSGDAFISPYDDVDVVLGNGASLGFEITRALGKVPDRVLAPFGGGGLSTGLAWAFARDGNTASHTRHVWGVQSEASCAMAMSIERGAAVERLVSDEETIAEGLEGGISARGFARAKDVVGGVVVVSERAIAVAMAHAYRELGLVIEGSSATALVPVLEGLPREVADEGGDVVVVLTGRNVDPSRLATTLC